MDTDWCLQCCRKLTNEGATYCSRLCYDNASMAYPCIIADNNNNNNNDDHWIGTGDAGIRAWASKVPYGPPSPSSSSSSSLHSYASTSSSSSSSLHRPLRRTPRTPALLLPHRRPTTPTLCMSTPQPARPEPSLPVTTPQQQIASLRARTGEPCSVSSILSSFIHTPASSSSPSSNDNHSTSVLDALRAWCAPPKHAFNITHLSPTAETSDDSDDDDDDAVWWVAAKHTVEYAHEKYPHDSLPQPRNLHLHLEQAYKTRGRKVSRALA